MANITFSSPRMQRDVTVYAVAGDRGTVLAVAKAHKIPIPFDCQDGDCGSCMIEVQHVAAHSRYGVAMTEKEKELLRQLGKISKSEIADAEVNDMPSHCRLACQMFVRNEDIIVRFPGDETLPEPALYTTPAAKVYTGGLKIQRLDEFLSLAVKVEEDAALHFDDLATAMHNCGNTEVGTLFAQLAGYSRLHLADARARCTDKAVTVQLPTDYVWPDHITPERTSLLAGDAALSRLDGLRVALQGERRGHAFYTAVGTTSGNPEVMAMAREFSKEEAEHVRVLEGWIAREEWLARSHATA